LSAVTVDPATEWPWVHAATTFWQQVVDRAERTPDDLLLADEHDQRLTCAQYRDRVERVAAALLAHGIGPDTRVAWQLPTRISTMLVMGALRRIGAVQAPIIPLYRDREVAAALRTSGAEVFLVPGQWGGFDFTAMAARIAESGGPAPRTLVIPATAPESEDVASLPTPEADPDAVRWIYFTSGSTGTPKGAQHTDDTLLSASTAYSGVGRLGRDRHEVFGVAYPVAHVGGVTFFATALNSGSALVLLEAFVPAQAIEVYRRFGVTITGGAPPFYTAFLAMAAANPGERLLPTLAQLKGGGAPCPPHLAARIRDELGTVLTHDYGMTEIAFIGIGCPDDPIEILAETDGRLSPFADLRLVDSDGASVAPGQVGETQLRGRSLFRGYTDEAENAAAFTEDGWFRTGDLGRIHPTGHIEVVGRTKDLIIRKGENVAPQEIEQMLALADDVADVAVIGIPDSDRGELVCAVVVPAVGAAPTLDGLNEFLLASGLMKQKLPERLELVDVLPRTGLAKVAKAELRARFAPS